MTPRLKPVHGCAAPQRLVVCIGERVDPAAARRLASLLFDSDTDPNRLAQSKPNRSVGESQGAPKGAGR
jgi:hypothetical protein